MATSEEFKRQVRAGKLTEALKLALAEVIELRITTWVMPTADGSHTNNTADQPQSKPGYRMMTRINIVDGEIENEVGSQFLNNGPYSGLREFHLSQVHRGREIIHRNLQVLRELFGTLSVSTAGQSSSGRSGLTQLKPSPNVTMPDLTISTVPIVDQGQTSTSPDPTIAPPIVQKPVINNASNQTFPSSVAGIISEPVTEPTADPPQDLQPLIFSDSGLNQASDTLSPTGDANSSLPTINHDDHGLSIADIDAIIAPPSDLLPSDKLSPSPLGDLPETHPTISPPIENLTPLQPSPVVAPSAPAPDELLTPLVFSNGELTSPADTITKSTPPPAQAPAEPIAFSAEAIDLPANIADTPSSSLGVAAPDPRQSIFSDLLAISDSLGDEVIGAPSPHPSADTTDSSMHQPPDPAIEWIPDLTPDNTDSSDFFGSNFFSNPTDSMPSPVASTEPSPSAQGATDPSTPSHNESAFDGFDGFDGFENFGRDEPVEPSAISASDFPGLISDLPPADLPPVDLSSAFDLDALGDDSSDAPTMMPPMQDSITSLEPITDITSLPTSEPRNLAPDPATNNPTLDQPNSPWDTPPILENLVDNTSDSPFADFDFNEDDLEGLFAEEEASTPHAPSPLEQPTAEAPTSSMSVEDTVAALFGDIPAMDQPNHPSPLSGEDLFPDDDDLMRLDDTSLNSLFGDEPADMPTVTNPTVTNKESESSFDDPFADFPG